MTVPTNRMRRATRPVGGSTGYPHKDSVTSSELPTPEEPTTSRITTSQPQSVPVEKAGPVARWVADKYRWIGALVESSGDPLCGQTITLSADAAGMAWQRAYKSTPFIRALLDRLMTSSVAADLFFANLPIFLAVMAHHNPGFNAWAAKSPIMTLAGIPPVPLKEEKKESSAA